MTDDEKPRSLHHRIYPYSTEVTQYAIDRGPDKNPWIVRDRSAALRAERLGEGKALVRTWIPTSWEYVNMSDEDEPYGGPQ